MTTPASDVSAPTSPGLASQVSVKLAAAPASDDLSALIPVFHRWIRDRVLATAPAGVVPAELVEVRPELALLPIDVADYRHVPRGPGVMLICHQGHLLLEGGGSGPGLVFARKRDQPGPIADKLAEGIAIALAAAAQLSREPELVADPLRIDPSALEVRVMNRLHAPNTADTYAALAPAIGDALAAVYGEAVELSYLGASGAPFGVTARASAAERLDPGELLDRVRARWAPARAA